MPDTGQIAVRNLTRNVVLTARHRLSARQIAMVLAGGQIPLLKQRSHP